MTEPRLILEDGVCTLAAVQNGRVVFRICGRGIGPALQLLDEQPQALSGAEVYDTIVGKAAAAIFTLGGAAAVYGQTMSKSALALLEAHGVEARFGVLTDRIINRQGTGLCPFEQAVLDAKTPEQCLQRIRLLRRSMQP